MKICGFDLETPQETPEFGLQPWRAATGEATIKTAAVWVSDSVSVKVKMPSREWFKKFLESAAKSNTTIATWNGLFEMQWLHALGLTKEINVCTWVDGMLLLKRLDGWRSKDLDVKAKGYGLKGVVAERWPEHADYGLGDDVAKVPQTDEEWTRLLDYNLLDSKFTCILAGEYLARLSPWENKAAAIEVLGMSPIALSAINGITINSDALDVLAADVKVRREKSSGELGVDPTVLASPKKLGKLLYEDWGLPISKVTPTGAPATDKEALLYLALENPGDPRFDSLIAMRKCNTQQAKFVDAVIASTVYHGANITRPSPFIAGTYTGRMTYSSSQGKGVKKIQTGIALHQWERGKMSRSLLEAPEGFLLAEFDASGQEMRLMADASGDETMLKLFSDGIDGHAYMGAAIEGLDWKWVHGEQDNDPKAKAARNLGKFANLSLQYRIGVDTIRVRALTQYGLNIQKSKAESIKATYMRTYAGVPAYWKSAVRKASTNTYAETRGNRRIVLKNLNDYAQQQTAINFPIQGTGGDMKELAIAVLRVEFNEDVMYAWDLHDALFLYVRDDDRAVETVKRIRERLNTLPYQKAWGWTPAIPLPWDAKLGKSWGLLKSVN